jgi:hypothetical protein
MAAKDLEKAEEQGLTEFFKLTSKINTSNMMAFNFEGKIQKYASPEEIIEEFYPQRLAYYQKRKASDSWEFRGWSAYFFGYAGIPSERVANTIRAPLEPGTVRENDCGQTACRVESEEERSYG